MRGTNSTPASSARIIAHRGACGYLPEHTLEAKALAFGLGADFLEQDVVLTRDHVPIVLHDIVLDTVTDVADRFPIRHRADGRYYAIDFTWQEISTLTVHERCRPGTKEPVYSQRFPRIAGSFRVPRLEDEWLMIHGLNQSSGRDVGIYPEIKGPDWHRKQGADISNIVLTLLNQLERDGLGFKHVFLQCFDPHELLRIHQEIGCERPLVQLIGENSWHEADCDYEILKSPAGMREIADYAQAIGAWIPQLIEPPAANCQGSGTVLPSPVLPSSVLPGSAFPSPLVRFAHAAGLEIHAYTVRADDLPPFAPDLDSLHAFLLDDCGVTGIFTDFPDLTRAFRDGS